MIYLNGEWRALLHSYGIRGKKDALFRHESCTSENGAIELKKDVAGVLPPPLNNKTRSQPANHLDALGRKGAGSAHTFHSVQQSRFPEGRGGLKEGVAVGIYLAHHLPDAVNHAAVVHNFIHHSATTLQGVIPDLRIVSADNGSTPSARA